MATLLLTEEEYALVKQLMTACARIPQSSPRAATHFSAIATSCARFLAREDGKCAQRQRQISEREQLEQAKASRRAQAQLQSTAQRPGRAVSPSA